MTKFSIDEINSLIEKLQDAKEQIERNRIIQIQYQQSIETYLQKYNRCMAIIDTAKEEFAERKAWLEKALKYDENQTMVQQCKLYAQLDQIKWAIELLEKEV